MAYPYVIKFDKSKITLGMMRRVSKNDLDAICQVVAALSVDENGAQVPTDEAIKAVDELTLADLEGVSEQLAEAFTPKVS